MKTRCFVMVFLLLSCTYLAAQDTLPQFTVIARATNRNVVSWTNPFKNVAQINIQRSRDSLRNFTTIMTVPDPTVLQNGFLDTRPLPGLNFYRIFIVFQGGSYQFTKSKRPVRDTGKFINEAFLTTESARRGEKFFFVKKNGIVVDGIFQKNVTKFRDSIVFSTRDTMAFVAADTIVIKPFIPKDRQKAVAAVPASKYIYVEKFGNVVMNLPDAGEKKYSVKFLEENKTLLFEVKDIKSAYLVVDKTNFVHSGWFWFELYEDNELKEQNKIFLPRDF
jgi:hypothetical protein